ncbi:MAG: ferrous iron transport protein B [Bacteroidota bacterium]|nr:ferrous iron transport protein B [Bacteroidota bacterium]
MRSTPSIAFVGNPNSGKTSLFNALTGLDQKVANFPGVTVEKAEYTLTFKDSKEQIILTDLPGAYSLHANTHDEFILTQQLLQNKPNAILYVMDIRYLDKQLLLLSQMLDLGYRTLIALTNIDTKESDLVDKAVLLLEEKTGCKVIPVTYKKSEGITRLKGELKHISQESKSQLKESFFTIPSDIKPEVDKVRIENNLSSDYEALLYLHYAAKLSATKASIRNLPHADSIRLQINETMLRYEILDPWINEIYKNKSNSKQSIITKKIDEIATHPFWGFILFTLIILIVFQAIFSWANFPMDAIERFFMLLHDGLANVLPQSWLSSLLIDGVLTGLSGVLVFIPQIAILFFLLGLLEEAGYMARVVYLFDHILRFFGLNGRSIVGLISGGACAVPAIMSTRNIPNWRERLTTMFVIPLIPCSARIPVYTVLIAFIVPYKKVAYIFNSQGLWYMGIYGLGIGMALLSTFFIRLFFKEKERSYLLMPLPDYQWPYMKQVLNTVWVKVRTFIMEAGKVIIIISIVLWFLANFSWPGEFKKVEQEFYLRQSSSIETDSISLQSELNALKIEHSFAGKFGKLIEPVIAPLGFDWKIGIALITSFAAREVFVGTMATIYGLASDDGSMRLRDRMKAERRKDGSLFFDKKTSLSLVIFYAFALQCMSTLAIFKRETGSWKWPAIQFIYMGLLAYLGSLLVYQLF